MKSGPGGVPYYDRDKFKPELAEDMNVGDMSVTFKLKKNAKFHDGVPQMDLDAVAVELDFVDPALTNAFTNEAPFRSYCESLHGRPHTGRMCSIVRLGYGLPQSGHTQVVRSPCRRLAHFRRMRASETPGRAIFAELLEQP
jgi:hypothetical protein